MKYSVVLLVLVTSILSINFAYGLWLPQTPEEVLEKSQVVFVGTITSVNVLDFEESSTSYMEENGIEKPVTENYILSLEEYSVSVEEFLKNPQKSPVLTVRQPTTSIPGKIIPQSGFELGDRVLFYIEEFDGTNTYSKESFLIPEQCYPSLVIHEPRMIGGDLKMMQNGIEKQDNFSANSPIQFVSKMDMGTLSGASLSYDAYISKQVGKIYKERVFNQTITADAKPCEWLSVATWEFTPDAGNYLLNGRIYKSESNLPIGNKFFSVLPEPPLKQINSGISIDEIQCKENLVLIQKYDDSPACVKPKTIEKLIERGWAKLDATESSLIPIQPDLGKFGEYELQQNNKIFNIKYHIKGGSNIKEIIPEPYSNAIKIVLKMYDAGSLEITLPRELIDAKISEKSDDLFFVFVDDKEVPYTETTNELERTLIIKFENDSREIKIMGVAPI